MNTKKGRLAVVIGLALLLAAPQGLSATKKQKPKPKPSNSSAQVARAQRERIELLELKVDRMEKLLRLQGGEARAVGGNLPPIHYP